MTLFDGVITGQAKAGLAYRGTPDDPHLSVGQILSPSFLFLASCPVPSLTNPVIQYVVATGKPVPVTPPVGGVLRPRTIAMQMVGGAWKVSDFLVDSNKTCSE